MKRYIKSAIGNLMDEPTDAIIEIAQNPDIDESTVESLAAIDDFPTNVRIRFCLMQNPGISDEKKSELRLRDNGRWVNFGVLYYETFCKCISDLPFDRESAEAAIEKAAILWGASDVAVWVEYPYTKINVTVDATIPNGYDASFNSAIYHCIEETLNWEIVSV